MKKLLLLSILLLSLASIANAEINVMFSANTLPDKVIENLDESSRIDIVKISDCKGTSTGRSLYDIMFKNKQVFKKIRKKMEDRGFNPTFITAHKESQVDGKAEVEKDDDDATDLIPLGTARRNELLRCLPDLCTTNPVTLAVTCIRPTVPYQPHKFYGWGDR